MPRTDRQPPALAATLVAAMGLYFVGAPTACFIFQSWWPLVIGLGAMLGVLCLVIAITLMRDAGTPIPVLYRDCSLCGTPILYGPEAEIPATPICNGHVEHADAGDLPRPVRKNDDREGQP